MVEGDAAKLNLIASHEMSKTYSVRGNRAIHSQQGPVTCSQVKRAITSAEALCYDPVATLWLQVCPCPKRECLRTLNYSSSSWRCCSLIFKSTWVGWSEFVKMRWSEFVKLLWSIFGQQPWTNKDGKKRPSRFCLQLLEIILVIQKSNSVTKHHQMSRSAPLAS